MTSYRYEVGPQARSIGRTVGRVRSELTRAVREALFKDSLRLEDIAVRMGVEIEELRRVLAGEQSLTLRMMAELLTAIDREVLVSVVDHPAPLFANHVQQTSTREAGAVLSFGPARGSSTTIYGMQRAIRKFVSTSSR